jgi:predicted alpha/beta hydrolase family esterase
MATVVFIHGADGFDDDALLVESLREHLGELAAVDYPRMPGGADWASAIAKASSRAERPLILVGHSAGAYQLLHALPSPALAVCLIAAPFPGGDPYWTFDGFELPDGLAAVLPAAVFLYASEDDETVPFAHRDLYAAAIPRAKTRTTTGGHQLGNDLRVVANDIREVFSRA